MCALVSIWDRLRALPRTYRWTHRGVISKMSWLRGHRTYGGGLEIWKWRPRSGQNLEIRDFGRAAAEIFGNELQNVPKFGNKGGRLWPQAHKNVSRGCAPGLTPPAVVGRGRHWFARGRGHRIFRRVFFSTINFPGTRIGTSTARRRSVCDQSILPFAARGVKPTQPQPSGQTKARGHAT